MQNKSKKKKKKKKKKCKQAILHSNSEEVWLPCQSKVLERYLECVNVDPSETQQNTASDQDLYCLAFSQHYLGTQKGVKMDLLMLSKLGKNLRQHFQTVLSLIPENKL